MPIQRVDDSYWYQATPNGYTNIPMPWQAQPGDLAVAIVAIAEAPPPIGQYYFFNTPSGYTEQIVSPRIRIYTRWVQGYSDPGITLPPTDLVDGQDANFAIGVIYVFRGASPDFGIKRTFLNGLYYDVDDGPDVLAYFPTWTGNDVYSVAVVGGDEMGYYVINDNPLNMQLIRDEAHTYPLDLRAIVFGKNFQTYGDQSFIDLTIPNTSHYWTYCGVSFQAYGPISAYAFLGQDGNTCSATAETAHPPRYADAFPMQAGNTLSSSVTAQFPPLSAVLLATQAGDALYATLTAVFQTRILSLAKTQEGDTLDAFAGHITPIICDMVQGDNALSASVVCTSFASLAATQEADSVLFIGAKVEIALSVSAIQGGNSLDSVINGRMLFADLGQAGNAISAAAAVDIALDAPLASEGDVLSADARQMWKSPAIASGAWGKKPSSGLWRKIVTENEEWRS